MLLRVNDTALFFDVEGLGLAPDGEVLRQRPTIVALHGGPGFDHAYFKPWLSSLAADAQVIYLDLRGQGRSSPAPPETCTLEAMADDVAACCRALGIEAPVVLGHSAGGFVALHLALRHPELPGGLMLVNTAAATADMDGAMARLEALRGAEARAAGERLFGGDFSLDTMAAFQNLVLPAYVHDESSAGPIFASLTRSRFAAEVATFYFRERAASYDLRDSLGHVAAPTLVLAGASDWLCAPAASRVIAAGIPGARLVEIPRAGHFSFAEQPAVFARAVRAFLASLSPRTEASHPA